MPRLRCCSFAFFVLLFFCRPSAGRLKATKDPRFVGLLLGDSLRPLLLLLLLALVLLLRLQRLLLLLPLVAIWVLPFPLSLLLLPLIPAVGPSATASPPAIATAVHAGVVFLLLSLLFSLRRLLCLLWAPLVHFPPGDLDACPLLCFCCSGFCFLPCCSC